MLQWWAQAIGRPGALACGVHWDTPRVLGSQKIPLRRRTGKAAQAVSWATSPDPGATPELSNRAVGTPVGLGEALGTFLGVWAWQNYNKHISHLPM